ncbi:hypothetical protein SLEP1_g22211 [Rubroshorea leprosula]|uniref:E2 ubiquitin-conjugating enzyme n=1 Tax=Rubroshorea leprosula TaxID=152421 RepID=A0AAV5JEK3_9ROSI|nr:hypothetical protein SLEP1_g22211 [Rubroshorea leprosula]
MEVFLADSDWESESGSEEQEIDFLYGGQAQIILSRLEESIGKIDDFLSFERAFAYGDIVCNAADQSGQTGRVVNINMFVDLDSVHGKVIKDVNSKELLKIRSFSVGDYVVHETWIGRVEKVVDRLSIVFDDGSKCEVTVMDPEKVVPTSPNLLEDSDYHYHPGQRVLVLPNVSKSARWLCGNWRGNQDEGIVSGVDAGLIHVDWIASARIGCGMSASPPPCLQDSGNLTLLSCFSHANWQLGDWCILPLADRKGIREQAFLHTPVHDLIKDQNKLERGFKRGNVGSKLEEIFAIVKTRTKVDVAWQDGSCSLGLDSQNLLPVGVVNAHEFWPEQFVLEKGTTENSKRWGVVQHVDAKERTVKVQWRNTIVNEEKDSDGKQMVETMSAYELVEHPDYSFCFGDIVFRVAQGDPGDRADGGHIISESGLDTEVTLKGKVCGCNQKGCPSICYLSCIGIVTGFEDGSVEVKWAIGISTKVAPYEIIRLEKYEGPAATPVLLEENSEELNQEMIAHEKQSCNRKGKGLVNSDGAGPNSFSLRQAAIGFFTNIASAFLGTLGSTSGPISADREECEILLEKEVLEACDLCVEPDPGELQTFGMGNSKQEVGDNDERKDAMFSREGEITDWFRQFDMVSDCSDHKFHGEGNTQLLPQMKRSWLKKVQEEWSILEKDLPETIYVRIYEERMDLLRAAVVGASGTPYHDGLFFFDIFFPPEYPSEPPLVHYNSGGLRLNPNLYESGNVCLSLLNTWTGSGTEVWNPDSTILQVLLSLQALVLNEKPYFNEAGYDKQIGRAEGEKNSINYNESAFLLNCKSMLYILHKPPKHFEALVKEHFSKRSSFILSACKAYMEDAPVGHAFEDGENEYENSKGSSTGFKIMLAKLFPKLVEAFTDIGIDCSQFTGPDT